MKERCAFRGCVNYHPLAKGFCGDICESFSVHWQNLASLRGCEGCIFCDESKRNWNECCTIPREKVSLYRDGECQSRRTWLKGR